MATTQKPKPPLLRLRMDKSKYFTTVHGERAGDDPHSKVQAYQDGLPFDAEGLVILELVPEDKKEMVERRMAKLNSVKSAVPAATQQEAPENASNGGNDDDDKGSDTSGDVNLESWLRGEARYPWFTVVAAIRSRFNKQVSNTTDAVTFLVEDEKVVTPDQLADGLKANYVPGQA